LYNPRAAGGAAAVGLPAPVRLLLEGLTSGILWTARDFL
jgi:hypothetical protein